MTCCRTLLFILLLVFAACEREDPPEPGPPDYNVPVSSDNLITHVTEVNNTVIFLLENDEQFSLPAGYILQYTVDTADWSIQLLYADSSEQVVPFFGNFGIPEETVAVNPYGYAPLTATVRTNLPYARQVRMTVHGRDPSSPDLVHVFHETDLTDTLPVYGLYEHHANQVTFKVLDNRGMERGTDRITLQTDSVGILFSGRMTVRQNHDPDRVKPRFFHIQNAVYDAEGYIRWYTPHWGTKYYPLKNGQMAIQLHHDRGAIPDTWEDFMLINLMGQVLRLYDVPNRVHHEICEKTPGGNFLVATNKQPYNSNLDDTEDAILEIDRNTGEPVKLWDLSQIFDPERPRWWIEQRNDWCHLNAIQYDSTDNSLLISSKLQCFIAKIDYETGAIRWILGNHEHWEAPWQPYLLEPLNFDTAAHPSPDWPYVQHMPRLTPDGRVIVYDNGADRPGGEFTRAHEYEVDEEQMTVRSVWTYDLDHAVKAIGSIHMYGNRNVLIGHGANGLLLEVNRNKEIVFEGQLQTFYRAYPFDFY